MSDRETQRDRFKPYWCWASSFNPTYCANNSKCCDTGTNVFTAAKIVDCLQHGCELGWLIDPGDRSVMVFRPKQEPEFYRDDQPLPVLEHLDLSLTANEIFGWLTLEL